MLLRQPLSFLLLFPASAGFWWFFEYLNRFAQNWSYTGIEFGPDEYFLFATLSFSTVLPAITGTRELLLSFSWWNRTYEHFFRLRISSPRLLAATVLVASGAGLLLLGRRIGAYLRGMGDSEARLVPRHLHRTVNRERLGWFFRLTGRFSASQKDLSCRATRYTYRNAPSSRRGRCLPIGTGFAMLNG